ncbi:MAG: TonB-dependent receptor [Wenzhouxiangella sp.]|nr:MAG: TonB-dependent receptor [Wenzhouxiangella sp.]
MFNIRYRLVLLLALTAMAWPAFAQQVSTGVTGQVLDQAGNAISGATIEITHEPTGTTRFTDSLGNGRFQAMGLRVGGPYRITAMREGFAPQTIEDVFLRLGETETLTFQIVDSRELDRLVVTGAPISTIFQAENMGMGTTIGSERIDNFASISRSINDYIRLDPRATVVDKGRNEISVGGGHNRMNNIQIDGVSANDSFGLNADAQPGVRQPVAIDWIEEISVQISPYDVSQTGGTGAIINSVTKSGSNEFSGRVYGNYRDESMIRGDFPDFEDWVYGAYLGGPILQDRLFFFVGYEKSRIDDVSGEQTGLRGSGAQNIFDLSPAEVDEIINIARGFGFQPGDTSAPQARSEQENYIAKVDWDISAQHRASLRYTRSEGSRANFSRNRTNFDLSSRFFTQTIDYDSWTLQMFSDWSPQFSTELRATLANYDASFDVGNPQPQVEIRSDAGTLRFGTERFRHANELTVDTRQIFFKGNYFTGDHSFDFGIDWIEEEYSNLFVESSLGTYTFDSIDGFRTGNTDLFYRVRVSADPNDPFFPRADFAWDVTGLFLQDTWTVSPDLTLQYGVRWEFFNTGDEPLRNQQFEQTFGFSNTGTLDGENILQPRIGFNWQPGNLDYQAQLRGGFGLFRGRNPGVWITNPFSNPGGTIDVFQCNSTRGSNQCLDLDPNFLINPDPNQQPRLGGITPAQDVDVVEDGFRLPTEWKANLAWDMELPGIERANLTLEYGKTWVRDSLYWTDENLGAVQGTLPDGRNHYWANPNTASGARDGRDRAFNNVIVMRNTSSGARSNATVSLDKTWSGDWGQFFGRVAYNYMNASDVSSATSSRAISSFRNQPVFNTNEEVSGRSVFEIGNSISFLGQYTASWFDIGATRFSTFLQYRDGRRFSWAFDGDMNGDGVFNNNLLYVPNFGEVRFVDRNGNPDAAGQAAFFQLVENVSELRRAQGSVVEKNSTRSSSVTQMDVRIAQDFNFGQRFRGQFFFDIENFTNLLNSSWGAIDQVPFNWTARPVAFEGVDPETGQMLYRWMGRGTDAGDYESRQDGIGQSRWRIQLGARFEF